MGIIINILISIATLAVGAVGLVNYVPLSWLSQEPIQKLGSTITTIAGTDTISSSRAVINTNFTNLNNDKIEVSTTTLPFLTTLDNVTRLGVIASSTWRGSSIGAEYGGTSSSTLASKRIMFGNGTVGFQTINFGTSGQFLTSNGEATLPSWTTSSLDQTLSYNFTGSTFRVKNLHASSTSANPLILNGVSLNTPSIQGASSTAFINDGSGNLKSIGVSYFLAASTTSLSPTFLTTNLQPVATTTASLPLAGNVLISVVANAQNDTVNRGCNLSLAIDNVIKHLNLGFAYSQNGASDLNLFPSSFTYIAENLTSGVHYFTLMARAVGGSTCTVFFEQMAITYLGS